MLERTATATELHTCIYTDRKEDEPTHTHTLTRIGLHYVLTWIIMTRLETPAVLCIGLGHAGGNKSNNVVEALWQAFLGRPGFCVVRYISMQERGKA